MVHPETMLLHEPQIANVHKHRIYQVYVHSVLAEKTEHFHFNSKVGYNKDFIKNCCSSTATSFQLDKKKEIGMTFHADDPLFPFSHDMRQTIDGRVNKNDMLILLLLYFFLFRHKSCRTLLL